MTKAIRICADDYGLSPGVSRAIRTLIAARRLNATSVMTLFPGLEEEAAQLLGLAQTTGAGIGLHLTFTGGFAPLAAAPLPGGALPPVGRLIAAAYLRRVDRAAVAREVEAQFAAFRRLFGRPPDHVDGHQHAHVLPGIRPIVLAATRRLAPHAWVRDCTPARGGTRPLSRKERLIGLFSRNLARDAARLGLATNTGFAGAYDFADGSRFAEVLAESLARLPDGGAMMVHPGHVDDVLRARDPLTDAREREAETLAGPDLPRLLAAAGARLA